MFETARRSAQDWILANRWGHEFTLPALEPDFAGTVRIGTLGTGFTAHRTLNTRTGTRTQITARMLAGLRMPLYVLDTRRNGVGGNGAWAPKELATIIPDQMGRGQPYTFVHLPVAAPSLRLLESSRTSGWTPFRQAYCKELTAAAVDVVRSFVEASALVGGMAVLLCAERYCGAKEWEALDDPGRGALGCHRFSLYTAVAAAIRLEHPRATILREDLDAGTYLADWDCGREYVPVSNVL